VTDTDHTNLLVTIATSVGEIKATQAQHGRHLIEQDRELKRIAIKVDRLERVDDGKIARRRWWQSLLGRLSLVAGIAYGLVDVASHFVAIPRLPHP
jgi:hypothetical protein